jgi:hypothetical protein
MTDYETGAQMPRVSGLQKEPAQNLPPANVIEYRLEDDNKVIFRPSGTEPKVKAYLFSKGKTTRALRGGPRQAAGGRGGHPEVAGARLAKAWCKARPRRARSSSMWGPVPCGGRALLRAGTGAAGEKDVPPWPRVVPDARHGKAPRHRAGTRGLGCCCHVAASAAAGVLLPATSSWT